MSPYESGGPEASAYLAFFDKLFPSGRRTDPYPKQTLESIVFWISHSRCTWSSPGMFKRGYLETLLLPWIVQQYGLQKPNFTAPPENIVAVLPSTESYKVALAPASFYTFAIFCFVTTTWCFAALCFASFNSTPWLTGYAEFDFSSKIDSESYTQFSRLLSQ